VGTRVGRDAFRLAVQEKYGRGGMSHAHNGFLDLGVSLGIPGVLLWLAFLGSFVVFVVRTPEAAGAGLRGALLLVIIASRPARCSTPRCATISSRNTCSPPARSWAPSSWPGPVAAREEWLILSHAFNMDGRAASHTITDKIPHLLRQGITPIVISAVTGRRDANIEHHQLLPLSPAGLRFDLRHVLRRKLTNRIAYNVVLGLVSLLLLPFYIVEKLIEDREPHWSWGPRRTCAARASSASAGPP
jgi:hypothetical protein